MAVIYDYAYGTEIRAIADYYKISIPRIYAILRHYNIAKRKSNNAKYNNSQTAISRNK